MTKHGIDGLNTLPSITQSAKWQSETLHPGTRAQVSMLIAMSSYLYVEGRVPRGMSHLWEAGLPSTDAKGTNVSWTGLSAEGKVRTGKIEIWEHWRGKEWVGPQGGSLGPLQLAGREGLETGNLHTTYSTSHILNYRELERHLGLSEFFFPS